MAGFFWFKRQIMTKKYLITSALPYVNNNLHIGHLIGCLLPSDVYARFCRAMGRDVLFVCGSDEHGTTSEIGAPNVRKDMLAVFAPIGAILPKTGKPIKPRNVAGVESAGMLCSPSELNLSDDDSGLYEITDESKIGQEF